jgi:hypothetical protein
VYIAIAPHIDEYLMDMSRKPPTTMALPDICPSFFAHASDMTKLCLARHLSGQARGSEGI